MNLLIHAVNECYFVNGLEIKFVSTVTKITTEIELRGINIAAITGDN